MSDAEEPVKGSFPSPYAGFGWEVRPDGTVLVTLPTPAVSFRSDAVGMATFAAHILRTARKLLSEEVKP